MRVVAEQDLPALGPLGIGNNRQTDAGDLPKVTLQFLGRIALRGNGIGWDHDAVLALPLFGEDNVGPGRWNAGEEADREVCDKGGWQKAPTSGPGWMLGSGK